MKMDLPSIIAMVMLMVLAVPVTFAVWGIKKSVEIGAPRPVPSPSTQSGLSSLHYNQSISTVPANSTSPPTTTTATNHTTTAVEPMELGTTSPGSLTTARSGVTGLLITGPNSTAPPLEGLEEEEYVDTATDVSNPPEDTTTTTTTTTTSAATTKATTTSAATTTSKMTAEPTTAETTSDGNDGSTTTEGGTTGTTGTAGRWEAPSGFTTEDEFETHWIKKVFDVPLLIIGLIFQAVVVFIMGWLSSLLWVKLRNMCVKKTEETKGEYSIVNHNFQPENPEEQASSINIPVSSMMMDAISLQTLPTYNVHKRQRMSRPLSLNTHFDSEDGPKEEMDGEEEEVCE